MLKKRERQNLSVVIAISHILEISALKNLSLIFLPFCPLAPPGPGVTETQNVFNNYLQQTNSITKLGYTVIVLLGLYCLDSWSLGAQACT
jgi:hypothetical protein